jgi:hypothetical protein
MVISSLPQGLSPDLPPILLHRLAGSPRFCVFFSRDYCVTTQSVVNLGLLPPCFNAVLSALSYRSAIQQFIAGAGLSF